MNKENAQLDPELQRQAMRSWTTGITIVTSKFGNAQQGMTVNSFTSVSLSPPVVSVSLAETTRTYGLVQQSNVFAVTILADDQEELADRFAGRGYYEKLQDDDRFKGVKTFDLVTGSPLITGGLAYLDCKVFHHLKVGETTVFFGEVVAARHLENGKPLVYFNRLYRGLQI